MKIIIACNVVGYYYLCHYIKEVVYGISDKYNKLVKMEGML